MRKKKEAKKGLVYEYKFIKNPYPGFFIAFEGLDGSGNSTQAARVANELKGRGIKVLVTKEPTNGPAGAMIRLALENRLTIDSQTLQMMFTVDRADHLGGERGITERLKKGEAVISDRFLASTLAFGYASGLDMNWLSALQSKFFLPDKTFFLDVDPELCIRRIEKGRLGLDLFEKKESLEKAKEGYSIVRKMFPRSMIVVNGEGKIEKITKRILSDIEKMRKYKNIIKSTQQALIE